ncbi:MAG: hypothetical protein ACREOE_10470 [Gemmatimonadales bacterium]
MATRVPARLSAADGRQFGLTVGGGFVVLGLIAWLRGRAVPTEVFGGLGVLLVGVAVVAPRSLGPVRRHWMRLATSISTVTTPVVMAVIYFAVVTPAGLIRRVVRRTARPDSITASRWVTRSPDTRRRTDMDRLF